MFRAIQYVDGIWGYTALYETVGICERLQIVSPYCSWQIWSLAADWWRGTCHPNEKEDGYLGRAFFDVSECFRHKILGLPDLFVFSSVDWGRTYVQFFTIILPNDHMSKMGIIQTVDVVKQYRPDRLIVNIRCGIVPLKISDCVHSPKKLATIYAADGLTVERIVTISIPVSISILFSHTISVSILLSIPVWISVWISLVSLLTTESWLTNILS